MDIASFEYEGRKVHLIDTPGFDDTFRSDAEVLKEIAYWLSSAYGSNVRLSGIIHLHPITSARMYGSALKNLQVLQKIWGKSILSSVALVTSMWDNIEPEVGTARERQLKSRFWQPLVEQGSCILRYENSRSSALSIIKVLMTKEKGTLEIQHEMVDQHKTLNDTAAGQELHADFDRRKFKLKHDLEESISRGEAVLAKELEDRQVELKTNIANIEADMVALNVGAEQLLAAKDKEFQKGLAMMQSYQAHYEGQTESLRNLMGSKQDLQQALNTGVVAASAAAAACVVM